MNTHAQLPPPNKPFSIGGTIWPGLSKLLEELGELVQVGGKLIGSDGDIHHFDGSNLRERLEEEISDVLAAIDFFLEVNPLLNVATIQERRARKLDNFRGWHHNHTLT